MGTQSQAFVTCPNFPLCRATNIRKIALKKHLRICPHRQEPCSLQCGAMIPISQRVFHETEECPERKEICPLCHKQIRAASLEHHIAALCRQRKVECRLCHEGGMTAAHRASVHRKRCRKRILECRNGCGTSLPADELVKHEKLECPARLLKCNQCGKKIKAKDLVQHQRLESAGAAIAIQKIARGRRGRRLAKQRKREINIRRRLKKRQARKQAQATLKRELSRKVEHENHIRATYLMQINRKTLQNEQSRISQLITAYLNTPVDLARDIPCTSQLTRKERHLCDQLRTLRHE